MVDHGFKFRPAKGKDIFFTLVAFMLKSRQEEIITLDLL